MRFGITPREWGDFLEDAIAQIKTAEECGFDSIWFEEHHGHPEYLPSPLGALNAVSQQTKLRLGSNILILPLYHPLRVAEEVAQLDVASHGRVILGVGAGYRQRDFANYGISLEERGEIMDESLTLLGRLLSEEGVTHDGKRFKLRDARVQPRPYQKPRPPIWVGGWKPGALRRAALHGDVWFPGPTASFSEVLACKKKYSHELERLSKKVPALPIMRDVYVAESTGAAFRESESSFVHMYQEDYSSSGHPLIGGQKLSFREWAEDRFIIGSPADVIEIVDSYKRNGFDYVVLRTSLRRLTNQQIISSIKLFGEKVIGYFSEDANKKESPCFLSDS